MWWGPRTGTPVSRVQPHSLPPTCSFLPLSPQPAWLFCLTVSQPTASPGLCISVHEGGAAGRVTGLQGCPLHPGSPVVVTGRAWDQGCRPRMRFLPAARQSGLWPLPNAWASLCSCSLGAADGGAAQSPLAVCRWQGGTGETQGRELSLFGGAKQDDCGENWPEEQEERAREPACAKAQRPGRTQVRKVQE